MIICGLKSLIIRCQFCGRIKVYEVNLFQAMKNNGVKYTCECGTDNVYISRGSNKDIRIELGCFNCSDKHIYHIGLMDILRNNNIHCYQGSQICFIGDKGNFKQKMLAQQDPYGDYFSNFEVLGKALKQVYFLDKHNRINCNCGNSNVSIEVFSDRIELICQNCNSVNIIFAETDEDLSILLRKDKIELRERNITCLDSINEKNRNIKKQDG